MKYKCVKLECEVCGNLATIQLFYNKSGAIKYARARHYKGTTKGKPQFEYHQQTLQYVKRKLELSNEKATIGHNGHQINNDQEKIEITPKIGFMAGPMGFEPMTFSLEG